MTSRYISRPSRIERFGMIVGGGLLVAVVGCQVAFVAWMAGFVG